MVALLALVACTEPVLDTAVEPEPLLVYAGADTEASKHSSLTLSGFVSSPTATVQWTQLDGPTMALPDSTTLEPRVSLPGSVGTVTLQLEATDGEQVVADQVTLTITNTAPYAFAGTDRTVLGGTLVVLDGTGSGDPDGDELDFHWELLTGPTATLSNPAMPVVHFEGPFEDGVMLFELTVDDGDGGVATDRVTISTIAE